MAIVLHRADCLDVLFGSKEEGELGSRLGVPYMRAQAASLAVTLHVRRVSDEGGEEELSLSFSQSSLGLCAISGVVWDAGLLLVDFLAQQEMALCMSGCGGGDYTESECGGDLLVPRSLGTVLELGTHWHGASTMSRHHDVVLPITGSGTGVVGVCCSLLGSCRSVLLTDAVLSDLLLENVDNNRGRIHSSCPPGCDLEPAARRRAEVTTLQFAWGSHVSTLFDHHWDSVICSDVLYDDKCHDQLLRTLLQLRYGRLYLSYKCRNADRERAFLSALEQHAGRARVAEGASVRMVNLRRSQMHHLHVIIFEGSCEVTGEESYSVDQEELL